MANLPERESRNYWKVTTIALAAFVGSALAVGVVMATLRDLPQPDTQTASAKSQPKKPAQPQAPIQIAREQPPPPPAPRRPSSADIQNCNAQADETRHTTGDTVKDAVIGGAAGAGIGAAGGAIAKGGRGAGKGAGIGGIIGAVGGTIYGLNEANKNDERAADVYRDCMASKGF